MDDDTNIQLYGYDYDVAKWIPLQVDINGALIIST